MNDILDKLTRDELYFMIHKLQDIQYELYKELFDLKAAQELNLENPA